MTDILEEVRSKISQASFKEDELALVIDELLWFSQEKFSRTIKVALDLNNMEGFSLAARTLLSRLVYLNANQYNYGLSVTDPNLIFVVEKLGKKANSRVRITKIEIFPGRTFEIDDSGERERINFDCGIYPDNDNPLNPNADQIYNEFMKEYNLGQHLDFYSDDDS